VLLGVYGPPGRFHALTGQRSQIRQTFMGLNHRYIEGAIAPLGPIPLVALISGAYGRHEIATPRGIATGRVDGFLFRLNEALAGWPGPRFYLRPFPEMNAYWESVCAYNANGTRRDAAHSTAWTRKAFARIAILARGGTAAHMNAALASLGLPGVSSDLEPTTPKLRIVWNPQGYGNPRVAGNSAAAYFPGNRFVDVVGDDLYDKPGHGAEWGAAESLYRAHPGKPFAVPEWSLWGFDDPAFIVQMAKFIRNHARLEFVAYYSAGARSRFDLGSKPRSRAAYRQQIVPLGRTLPPPGPPPPPPPPPSGTATGTVLVNGQPFTEGVVPYGSTVDVTKGSLSLTTRTGTIQVSGDGVTSIFVISKGSEKGKALDVLRLTGGDFSLCATARTYSRLFAPSAPLMRQPPIRRIKSKAKGKFRVKGKYSYTTVRGTIWLVADRCDGTLTSVTRGKVDVYDFHRRKTIHVLAHHSYLARRP
jgi:hypothetical protein